jgi:hypothetical protein
MAVELAHPTELDAARVNASERFVVARMDRCADARWHFKMAVPKDFRLGPQGEEAPTDESAPTLALFKNADPEVDLEVIGHELKYEIDPADWLEMSLEQDDKTIVSRRPVRLLAGVTGDMVATWEVDGKPFAGRFTALKWGPRLYVIALRTAQESYDRFADDYFMSMASFAAVDDSLGLFAERVHTVVEGAPVPWKLVIPISWVVDREPMYVPEVGSLQARQIPHQGDLADFAGQLTLAVVERDRHKKASELGARFVEILRERGMQLEPPEFTEEEAPKGFKQSWSMVSPVSHLESVGEARCRVMLHGSAWVLGGVIGPPRDHQPLAWMRNKRALDIATSTLEIGS